MYKLTTSYQEYLPPKNTKYMKQKKRAIEHHPIHVELLIQPHTVNGTTRIQLQITLPLLQDPSQLKGCPQNTLGASH